MKDPALLQGLGKYLKSLHIFFIIIIIDIIFVLVICFLSSV